MPTIKSWIALLAIAAPLVAASFSTVIEDDVDIYVSIRSLAESRSQWETHPIAEVIENPQLQAFFEPLFQSEAELEDEESFTEVLKNDFGLTWDEVFELFPGQVTIACFNVPELILKQAERPELVILAEYAGEPDQLTELMQVQFERNAEEQQAINPAIEHTMIEETFMGETLHFDETFDGEQTYIEDGYALVEGIFILATPEDRLRSAVEAIKDKPEDALAENSAYLRSREEGGRGDLEVYFNLEAIMPPLNTSLIGQLMQSGAFMLGLNAESLNTMLSLESLQAFFFDIDLIEAGAQSHGGILYREKVGLLSLMTYTDAPLPEARFVPNGVFSSSITNFDLGEMLTQLETLLVSASPNLRAQIDSQMQMMQTNTGVDLRSAVLGNFAGDLVSLSILPEGGREGSEILEPDQVFIIALEDAEALSGALEAFKDLAPGVREQILTQEFAGQTICTFNAVPSPNITAASPRALSYVITRSHLILSIGRVGLLQEVLSRMESGESGFWQETETEDLFAMVERPHAVSRSYIDLEKLVIPIFQSIAQTSQLGGDATALDMERIPQELSVPFYLITETNAASDGLFSRSLILPREDSK